MTISTRETQVLSQLAYLYLLQGYHERAGILYAGLRVLEPDVAHHLRGLALSRARAGQSDQALEALDQLALSGAVDATFYSLRARVLSDLGRLSEAQAAMRTCLSIKSSRPANNSASFRRPA
jgi:Flp pilus assembly protein TadD